MYDIIWSSILFLENGVEGAEKDKIDDSSTVPDMVTEGDKENDNNHAPPTPIQLQSQMSRTRTPAWITATFHRQKNHQSRIVGKRQSMKNHQSLMQTMTRVQFHKLK